VVVFPSGHAECWVENNMVGWALILAIFLFVYFYWDYRRTEKAKSIVKEYFEKSEFKITKMVAKNPYLMVLSAKGSNKHIWFYTEFVKDDGTKAKAQIRVGDWLVGLAEPIVEVYWL
jgi:hypothetical protein